MKQDYSIIFITSRSYSGSTLLDTLISSHSEVAGLGEVKVLSSLKSQRRRVYALTEEPCMCDSPRKIACPFWRSVEKELRDSDGLSLFDLELGALETDTFRTHNDAFFRAASRASDCRFLVDSSKDLRRLQRLREAGFKVKCVHLLRSPLGVIHSHLQRGREWEEAAETYNDRVLATHRYLQILDHISLPYELLATRPAETLGELMPALGLSFEAHQLDWSDHIHHHVAGNRKRFRTSSMIRLDEKWKQGLTVEQKLRIGWATAPAWFSVHRPTARHWKQLLKERGGA